MCSPGRSWLKAQGFIVRSIWKSITQPDGLEAQDDLHPNDLEAYSPNPERLKGGTSMFFYEPIVDHLTAESIVHTLKAPGSCDLN